MLPSNKRLVITFRILQIFFLQNNVLKDVYCETPFCLPLCSLNGGTWGKGHLGRHLLNCTCPLGFAGWRCEHKSQNPSKDVKIRHYRNNRHDIDSADVRTNPIEMKCNKPFQSNLKMWMKLFKWTGHDSTKQSPKKQAHCASNPCRKEGRCDNSHAAPAPGFFTCLCSAKEKIPSA